MRYFYQLAGGVMVMPLMAQLVRKPHLWNADKARTTFEGTPHGAVDDILLRFGTVDVEVAGDDLEAMDTLAMAELRGAKDLARTVMNLVEGTRLGRVVITRLEPGKKILPHADVKGAYTNYYTRYHVVLQGLSGSTFTCGDEAVQMKTGDIWWFDAKAEHSVINNSADDRVHMLVDVRIDSLE